MEKKIINSKIQSLLIQIDAYSNYVKILEDKLRKLYDFKRLEQTSYEAKENYENLTELEKLEDSIDLLFSNNVKMKQLIEILDEIL